MLNESSHQSLEDFIKSHGLRGAKTYKQETRGERGQVKIFYKTPSGHCLVLNIVARLFPEMGKIPRHPGEFVVQLFRGKEKAKHFHKGLIAFSEKTEQYRSSEGAARINRRKNTIEFVAGVNLLTSLC